MSKGCTNFRLGNALTTLKGGGGSGEPTTREVVQGVRTDFGGSASVLGGWAAGATIRTTNPTTRSSDSADAARGRRRPPGEDDSMSSTPKEAARTRVRFGTRRVVGPL